MKSNNDQMKKLIRKLGNFFMCVVMYSKISFLIFLENFFDKTGISCQYVKIGVIIRLLGKMNHFRLGKIYGTLKLKTIKIINKIFMHKIIIAFENCLHSNCLQKILIAECLITMHENNNCISSIIFMCNN